MKTFLIRSLVITAVLAAFGLLALSPSRADNSSASSNDQDGPMGCCGSKQAQINCPSGFHPVASEGAANCVKDDASSNTSSEPPPVSFH